MTPKSTKSDDVRQRIAIFPGSFDPFTIGHWSIVNRALDMFDQIVIAIGRNDAKHSMFSTDRRIVQISSLYEDNPKVKVVAYEGLTVNAAQQYGARFILRGVRMIQDFEYEKNLAEVNRSLTGIETVLLYTLPEHSHISSSIVRELLRYGCDVSRLLPPGMTL
ncbi:MAG: pantetheine-phosphate adenylyltransferase [Muribaculaceae bacterium]